MPKTSPSDTTVTLESRDNFSAWPILFGKEHRDASGFWFDSASILQPPFEAYKIIFQFFAPDPDNAAISKPFNLVVAEVVRWRINAVGLWVRGKFYEPPEPDNENHPHTHILDGLKAEMRRSAINLTHTSLRPPASIIREDGYASVYPIQLFTLYEKAILDEIPPRPEA